MGSCKAVEHLVEFIFICGGGILQTLEKRCDDELRRRDVKIMQELDKKVMDQQGLLEKAGVPGFFVTNARQELQLQMYLLDFICRVARTHAKS